jgi:hypothetical protein
VYKLRKEGIDGERIGYDGGPERKERNQAG